MLPTEFPTLRDSLQRYLNLQLDQILTHEKDPSNASMQEIFSDVALDIAAGWSSSKTRSLRLKTCRTVAQSGLPSLLLSSLVFWAIPLKVVHLHENMKHLMCSSKKAFHAKEHVIKHLRARGNYTLKKGNIPGISVIAGGTTN